MNAERRPARGGAAGWEPDTTIVEASAQLRHSTWPPAHRALTAAALDGIAQRILATSRDIEADRLTPAVVAHLGRGWLDAIARVMADLVEVGR